MSWTGLDAFDTAIQKADKWLKEIMLELNTDNKHRAYAGMRAVLHALRDRLIIDEAVDLGAQLPLLIRGVYYDEWDPSRNPIKDRHLDDFLARVQTHFRNDSTQDIEQTVRAVFKVIRSKVTDGEIKDVKGMMPEELRTLWK
jgi:uncharacterized protein (DUF2267 family)